jgi:hypothetical protein
VPLTRAPLARRRWRAGRGLYSIIDRLKNFNVHAGFVLEGTADDELPELILGAGRWPFADHSQPLGHDGGWRRIDRARGGRGGDDPLPAVLHVS